MPFFCTLCVIVINYFQQGQNNDCKQCENNCASIVLSYGKKLSNAFLNINKYILLNHCNTSAIKACLCPCIALLQPFFFLSFKERVP